METAVKRCLLLNPTTVVQPSVVVPEKTDRRTDKSYRRDVRLPNQTRFGNATRFFSFSKHIMNVPFNEAIAGLNHGTFYLSPSENILTIAQMKT